MKSSSKLLFLSTVIMSTIMMMSSNNLITMWISMEINLLSFIPLISKSNNMSSSETSMTYFMVQSMSSMLFIMSMMISKFMLMTDQGSIMMTMMMMSMMMKLGMPPFHQWFPQIMNKMKWKECLMLMSWQKIAPMYVMTNMMTNKTMYIMIMSTMIGSIMGLNHTSMRKIMAYSSINHMGWMLACSLMNKKSWMLYLTVYTSMILMLCLMMNKYNIYYINQTNMQMKTFTEKMSFTLMMLSMGGMPPMLGFFPKWMVIQYMISSTEMLIIMIMMMSTLVTLFYYMRMINTIMIMNSQSQKWTLMKSDNMLKLLMMNLTLPMIMIVFMFM
uniref:NADH-ubiquinone oxidoreductase chain 2 n=1 Tax=Isometopus sp. TaxID=2931297 RepID=A0A8T9ZZS3_9HEMI|nr:NADH dehydrogenase subunit 2 [Isometopus sp.]